MDKKDDIQLEIADVVEEEKATAEMDSIKEQTKKTLRKIKENAKEEDPSSRRP